VKDDNTVEQREVTEGSSVDGVVQILSGIKVGEKIVVEGMSVLADGSKIKDITNGVVKNAPTDTTKTPTDETAAKSSKYGKKGGK
jgi:membrane fusion protein (multidrug efflux system)